MLSNAQILRYDVQRFPFVTALERTVFKVRPLEQLHVHWSGTKQRRGASPALTYADNLALRQMMQDLPDNSPFLRIYHRFAREIIAPLFGRRISYSHRPKMRVHLAGTPTVSTWHRDVDVTGRPDQINAFLPFTRVYDSNSLWCESEIGLKDYRPIALEVGDVFFFDGGYLEHGTVANDTPTTRCSLDFRFSVSSRTLLPPWSEILAGRPARIGGNPLRATG
jgi:hypothetical protein